MLSEAHVPNLLLRGRWPGYGSVVFASRCCNQVVTSVRQAAVMAVTSGDFPAGPSTPSVGYTISRCNWLACPLILVPLLLHWDSSTCRSSALMSEDVVNTMITYRPFTGEDADAVADVARVAWAWTYAGIFAPEFIVQFVATHYAPERLQALAPAVAAGHVAFDLVLDGEKVVGFCNLGSTAHGAELWRIYLLPTYVGRGIGAALLARGEDFLRAQGIVSYRCFVHRANQRGQQFYARQGFRRVPEHDREDEWCLEKQLPGSPNPARDVR